MPGRNIAEWLSERGFSAEFQENLVLSLAALVLGWLLNQALQRFAVKRIKNPTARYSTRKAVQYTLVLGVAVLVGRVWFSGIDSFATALGLVSAGVAIALKDPVTNLAGWAFLVTRHPFRVGDRIQVGEHAGDVVDVGLFQFSLQEIGVWVGADQPTGRVIHVPNAAVFREAQLNYHLGLPYIWDEVATVFTFESDWEAARAVLQDIAGRHAISDPSYAGEGTRGYVGESGYFMLERSVESTLYTTVKAEGVEVTIRYAVDPRRRRFMKSTLWEEILRAVAIHPDLHFAYPTYRWVHEGPINVDASQRAGATNGSAQEHA
jgi:small-conductance mechanosensitive channel